jgi:predicted nucleic acid-binding protein
MKPTLIIDCSMTMAWCFADEGTDETAKIQDRLIAEAAVVPAHWFLEVANVLAMAEKRGRISAADSTQFVKLLTALDIQVDDEFLTRAFDHILPLSRSHALTSYDAAYLDLALRRQLPLASLDDNLRQVATRLGVEVLGK